MQEAPRAVIVGVALPSMDDEEQAASLAELERLVTTLGYQPVARVTQPRISLSPAAVLGEGKLKELAELTGGTGRPHPSRGRKTGKSRQARDSADREGPATADDDQTEPAGNVSPKPSAIALVAVNHELTPSQARNLEHAAGVPVLDRTGVIIEIFHRHARTREARLEVEMARLKYLAPRVRESPSGKERQAGRGAGEAAIELDRRRIRDRIAELRQKLDALGREQGTRRAQRRSTRRVVLVGYTNAGKSSLMRALTASPVTVEDRLFATLDTTVRALQPETRPRILVSDTVGFIRNLPHDLVASFKSTLDEALEASLLLHVVDAADPSWEGQERVTREVLAEIGADGVPSLLVMNKIDRVSPAELAALREARPDAWFVSARDPAGVSFVREGIVRFFETRYVGAELVVPYSRQSVVAMMHDAGRVESQSYEEDGVHVSLRADPESIARFRSLIEKQPTG